MLPQRNCLAKLLQAMQTHGLTAYYLPPEDEHLNEYLPDCKKRIEYLTGFSGESAPLLVTANCMHVFVDGRFHLQVDAEVDASVVEAHKLPANQSSDSALKQVVASLCANDEPVVLGYDPFTLSAQRYRALQKALSSFNVQFKAISGNLVDAIWTDRPALPDTPVYALPDSVTGQSAIQKLQQLRQQMQQHGAAVLPLTKLDDIAWLFNLRGVDIPYNPVFESYAIITPQTATLFVPQGKVPPALAQQLASFDLILEPYANYAQQLEATLKQTPQVLVDTSSMTMGTYGVIEAYGQPVEARNPVTWAKAHKNPTEIMAMHQANRQASRAIIRHLAHIHAAFRQGTVWNEATLRADLEAKYREEPQFVELSFPTIPGVGANSAIIHYSHADETQVVQNGSWYLLDSGVQYTGGTTDTTRTTVFGQPTPDQIEKYTLVLKAHIACAMAVFPQGTNGAQLDAICRAPMWQAGLDFAHGTGHGVGAFLNVHEGPNRISKLGMVTFEPGMITSIEPGYYQADWGGIRLENLYVVTEATHLEAFQGKPWYQFESLTLVPFERQLIDLSRLTSTESDWIKRYYERITAYHEPNLSPVERGWLQAQCQLT